MPASAMCHWGRFDDQMATWPPSGTPSATSRALIRPAASPSWPQVIGAQREPARKYIAGAVARSRTWRRR